MFSLITLQYLSSIDMCLLDGVDVRIRLELANQDWVVKSSAAVPGIGLNITKAKLWIDIVTPHHNAMTALSQAMTTKPLEYIFDKTLYKTFGVGTGESSIIVDQPFANCIPEKQTMVLVDMSSMSEHASLTLYILNAVIYEMYMLPLTIHQYIILIWILIVIITHTYLTKAKNQYV